MTEAKHTKLPWKHDKNLGCKTIKGGKHGKNRQGQYREVAYTPGLPNDEEDLANAELIVRAVNSHDALVEACEAGLAVIYDMRPSDKFDLENTAQRLLEQALAKAKGES